MATASLSEQLCDLAMQVGETLLFDYCDIECSEAVIKGRGIKFGKSRDVVVSALTAAAVRVSRRHTGQLQRLLPYLSPGHDWGRRGGSLILRWSTANWWPSDLPAPSRLAVRSIESTSWKTT